MDKWTLMRGDTVLGHLTYDEGDFPWIYCKFVPTADFALVAPLFGEELALLNEERMEEWDEAYEKIVAAGLRLVPVANGEVITEFILHIEGDTAWFRY